MEERGVVSTGEVAGAALRVSLSSPDCRVCNCERASTATASRVCLGLVSEEGSAEAMELEDGDGDVIM